MQITVKHDGRTVELDASRLGWLRAVGLDGPKADQIETATVMITMEGEEPIELMLPKGMVEMMLESVGASAPAPAAAPEGMEQESMAEDAGMEREDGQVTMDAVKRLIARELGELRMRERHVDARDAEVRANARALHVDASDGRHWTQVALDAIVKAAPDQAEDAKRLAAAAKRGDAVAEGRLRERLATLAAGASERGDSTMTRGKPVKLEQPQRRDARAPWERGLGNKKESN